MNLLRKLPDRRFLLASLGLTILALVARLPLLGDGGAGSDTTGYYLPVAERIVDGVGFQENIRPPGYPLLLAGFDWAGADPIAGVVLLQNLVGILLPTLVLFVGWRYFNPATGILAGFLVATSPLTFLTEQAALPDYLFGVVSLVAATLLAEAAIQLRGGRRAVWLLLGAGVVFGLATLLRPNGQLALVLIPLVLLFAVRDWRLALRSSAIALAAFVAILLPWVVHNIVEFDSPSVSTEAGISLYGRAITSEYMPPPTDSAEGRVAFEIYNAGSPTVSVYNAFIADGMTQQESAGTMGSLAREKIAEYPGDYALDTLDILGQYVTAYEPYVFNPHDHAARVQNELRGLTELETIPGESSATNALWQASQVVAAIVFAFAFAGLLVLFLPFVGPTRSRIAAFALLLFVASGLIGSALFVREELRFAALFAPLAWILLSAAAVLALRPLAVLVSRLASRGRDRVASALERWRRRLLDESLTP